MMLLGKPVTWLEWVMIAAFVFAVTMNVVTAVLELQAHAARKVAYPAAMAVTELGLCVMLLMLPRRKR